MLFSFGKGLTIAQEADPDTATVAAFEDGLGQYNRAHAGHNNALPLWLIARNKKGAVQAGIKAISYFNWMFVDWLWVAEEHRGKDYGTQLMAQLEAVARERGCVGVFLDTFTFQAPAFYTKLGYKEFGRVPNFPPGFERIYFTKTL